MTTSASLHYFPINETPAWLQHLLYEWKCIKEYNSKVERALAVAQRHCDEYGEERVYQSPAFQSSIQLWNTWRDLVTSKHVSDRTPEENEKEASLRTQALAMDAKWKAMRRKFAEKRKHWYRREFEIRKTPWPRDLWDEATVLSKIQRELNKLNEHSGLNLRFFAKSGCIANVQA